MGNTSETTQPLLQQEAQNKPFDLSKLNEKNFISQLQMLGQQLRKNYKNKLEQHKEIKVTSVIDKMPTEVGSNRVKRKSDTEIIITELLTSTTEKDPSLVQGKLPANFKNKFIMTAVAWSDPYFNGETGEAEILREANPDNKLKANISNQHRSDIRLALHYLAKNQRILGDYETGLQPLLNNDLEVKEANVQAKTIDQYDDSTLKDLEGIQAELKKHRTLWQRLADGMQSLSDNSRIPLAVLNAIGNGALAAVVFASNPPLLVTVLCLATFASLCIGLTRDGAARKRAELNRAQAIRFHRVWETLKNETLENEEKDRIAINDFIAENKTDKTDKTYKTAFSKLLSSLKSRSFQQKYKRKFNGQSDFSIGDIPCTEYNKQLLSRLANEELGKAKIFRGLAETESQIAHYKTPGQKASGFLGLLLGASFSVTNGVNNGFSALKAIVILCQLLGIAGAAIGAPWVIGAAALIGFSCLVVNWMIAVPPSQSSMAGNFANGGILRKIREYRGTGPEVTAAQYNTLNAKDRKRKREIISAKNWLGFLVGAAIPSFFSSFCLAVLFGYSIKIALLGSSLALMATPISYIIIASALLSMVWLYLGDATPLVQNDGHVKGGGSISNFFKRLVAVTQIKERIQEQKSDFKREGYSNEQVERYEKIASLITKTIAPIFILLALAGVASTLVGAAMAGPIIFAFLTPLAAYIIAAAAFPGQIPFYGNAAAGTAAIFVNLFAKSFMKAFVKPEREPEQNHGNDSDNFDNQPTKKQEPKELQKDQRQISKEEKPEHQDQQTVSSNRSSTFSQKGSTEPETVEPAAGENNSL